MNFIRTTIPDVIIIEPKVFGDERGFFFESYNEQKFQEFIKQEITFVQDNHSRSTKHVLRGLHYQIQQPQGKLVRVVSGEVYDVAVDLRKNSATFGKTIGKVLSEQNQCMLWVPPGFAHGFVVISETTEFLYKTTDYYAPEYERTLAWNDPCLNIEWPISTEPTLSEKDRAGTLLSECEVYE